MNIKWNKYQWEIDFFGFDEEEYNELLEELDNNEDKIYHWRLNIVDYTHFLRDVKSPLVLDK